MLPESERLSIFDKIKLAILGVGACFLWLLLLIVFPLFIFTTIQVLIRLIWGALRWVFRLVSRWLSRISRSFTHTHN